jgi:hypothetical protein
MDDDGAPEGFRYAGVSVRRVERPYTRRLYALAWSADSELLATADDATKPDTSEAENVAKTFQVAEDEVRA